MQCQAVGRRGGSVASLDVAEAARRRKKIAIQNMHVAARKRSAPGAPQVVSPSPIFPIFRIKF